MGITHMLGTAFGKVIGFIPNIVAALVILAVGLFAAKILERVTRRVLAAMGLDRRPFMHQILGREGSLERVPWTGGRIVYWLLSLVTVGIAVDALHLAWLSAGVARILAYVPSLVAAGAVVVAGYFIGNFAFRRLTGAEGRSPFLARVARGAIFTFAGFMALQQLGIATAIVTTAFTVALSAMAVAAALAFGLGNRELAGRITRDWYDRRDPVYHKYDPTSREDRPGQAPPH